MLSCTEGLKNNSTENIFASLSCKGENLEVAMASESTYLCFSPRDCSDVKGRKYFD